jgi:hypothetical protein
MYSGQVVIKLPEGAAKESGKTGNFRPNGLIAVAIELSSIFISQPKTAKMRSLSPRFAYGPV